MPPGFAVSLATHLRADPDDPSWPDRDRVVMAEPGDDDAALPGEAVALGVGSALAERLLAARFGRSLVDHRTWVLAGADDLDAGLGFEAMALAGELRLDRLVVLHATEADTSEVLARARVLGWAAKAAAEEPDGLEAALSFAARARRPTLVVLGPRVAEPRALQPDPIQPETAGHGGARRAWLRRLARHPLRQEFERVHAGRVPEDWRPRANGFGGLAALPELFAVTSGSPGPAAPAAGLGAIRPAVFGGRHLDAGPRALGAAMLANGAATHGGVLPCVGFGQARVELSRPALIRAAAAGLRVIHAVEGTGPVPALRGLSCWIGRPGTEAEAAMLWDLAVRRTGGPMLLLPVPPAAEPGAEPGVEPWPKAFPVAPRVIVRGGYVLAAATRPKVTLLAEGAAVPVALGARAILGAERVAVASFPCRELFDCQDAGYRASVLGPGPRIALLDDPGALGDSETLAFSGGPVTPASVAAFVSRQPGW